jgi:uncharacterized SAM-binding protein YcdF (DUF218 family)
MGFMLSKLLWLIVAPSHLLLLGLLAGALLLAIGRARWGNRIIAAIALLLLANAILPLGAWALRPLEQRFPPLGRLAQVDGIILLGGAVEERLSHEHDQVALDDAAERVVEVAALARLYPQARLLLSGGSGALIPEPEELPREAVLTAGLLARLGIDETRFLIEDRSRNTVENAQFSAALAHPAAGEVWLLVTSAAHMPRAVGCFRAVGWSVLPYPVDYRADTRPRLGFEPLEHLALLDAAGREWIGLLAYRLMGRTDALFPGPAPSAASNSR